MMFSVRWYPPCAPWLISIITTEARRKKKKNRSTRIKRMERSRMAVSPFDGVNRIRFKGSPQEFRIADCEFRIFTIRFRLQFAISNPNFAILTGLSATISRRSRLPRNVFDFQSVETILGLFIFGCKLPWGHQYRFAPLRAHRQSRFTQRR